MRTRQALSFVSVFLLGLVSSGCPDPCRLIRTEAYGIYPTPLISHYEWDDSDDLRRITRTQVNPETGEEMVEYTYYSYDLFGRLEQETFSAANLSSPGLYSYYREIRYEYDHLILDQPSSASQWLSINNGPLTRTETAYFDYLYQFPDHVLDKITYHDEYGEPFGEATFMYEDSRLAMQLYDFLPDSGQDFRVTEYRYDGKPATGERIFGDMFHVMYTGPFLYTDPDDGHQNVAEMVFENFRDGVSEGQSAWTMSYRYRDDGLPAERTFSAFGTRTKYFYECPPAD